MQADPNFDREREIFLSALDRSTPQEREAYLNGACGTDAALRRRLEGLLRSHSDDSFLARSVSDPVVAASAAAFPKAGTIVGRYKLLQPIGEGGCGVVFMAEQEEGVRRRVALKVIKPGMDTKSVIARFEAERQALALMDHPNIAKVFDVGATETGRPYFVMELVRGTKITEYCDEHGLSVAERLNLFVQACRAVQHAHQKGVIHRDLKPSNILVTVNEGLAVPMVIDFGIAKAAAGQRLTDETFFTAFEQFVGTPAYMSPEQAEMTSLDIDTRSDIYSLGVLLYELLTGQTPFNARELLASGLDEMRRTIREREPLRPSTRLTRELAAANEGRRAPGNGSADREPDEILLSDTRRRAWLKDRISCLRGDLDWIVMKCLEKERARRYDTAIGLATDIRRHLNNETVSARPPGAAYRFQKAFRRNRFAFAAAAAVVTALLMGLLTALWQAGVARNAVAKLEANLYRTRLTAAYHELTAEPANILRAETLLEACRSDVPDWEWRYLKRLRLVDTSTLRDPATGGVNSVSFSADGRSVASAGADGRVRIWNVSASPLPRTPERTFAAHTGFVFCVAFHPKDSSRLVSAGSDNRVKLWDLSSGTTVGSWPCGFSFEWGLAYAVAFSPDGQRLAFSRKEGSVTVFENGSLQPIRTLAFPDARPVFGLAFSPDGRLLATGHGGGLVRLWDVETGLNLNVLGRLGAPIGCVAFSRVGRRLTAVSFDGYAQVWSLADLDRPPLRFPAHTDLGVGLALSIDGRRLVTSGHDRTTKIWDPDSGQEVISFRDVGKQTCVVFSADGNRLAASGTDGTIQLWDATPLSGSDDASRRTLSHPLPVTALDISGDGERIACGLGTSESPAEKDRIVIWEASTGRELGKVPGPAVYTFDVSFSPAGRLLASVGDDQNPRSGLQRIRVLDVESGQAAFAVDPFPGLGVLFSVAYHPDGRRLVAAGQDRLLKVWDAGTGRKVGVLGEHDRNVFNLEFSPDGRYLASAGKDGPVRIWDGTRLDERQSRFRELGSAGGDIADTMAFGPDSKRLAIVGNDLGLTIWDVDARTRMLNLPHTPAHAFRAVAFSPDGRWFASGGIDGSVRVWDSGTGDHLHTFRGHQGNVIRLRFVKRVDGLHLVSSSQDSTVKLWPLETLEGQHTTSNGAGSGIGPRR